jgi:nitrogen fixation protein FixH
MIPTLAREGEDGFVHQVNTGEDSSADFVSCTFHYKNPAGTVINKTCDNNTASEGKYGWQVTADFFTEGRWELQTTINRGVANTRKLKSPIVFWIGGDGE